MTQGTDPADEARYKPLGELFNDKKGSVTVDIIQGDAGGGAVNAQAKLIALVASGTAPDVFWTHAYISPNLQKLNLLADISPYLASDKDVKLTDFFEAATKDYNVGGKQYGLPREATTTNLVYNKELFAKNGVSLPDESWTWETYLDAAKKMTGGTGAQATWGTAGWAGVGAAPTIRISRCGRRGRHCRCHPPEVHFAPVAGGGSDAMDRRPHQQAKGSPVR